MKKNFLFLILILFLYSCSNLPFYENDELGNLIDAENDRLYLYSGSYLRAAEIIKTPYARYDDYGTKRTLHEIPGIEPEKWLSENIETSGLPLLFRDSGIDEPTLENFGTSRILIIQSGESNMQLDSIDDEQKIKTIVNDYLYGENITPPEDIQDIFLFYFESPDYPGIHYVLQYIIASDWQEYLLDRWTKRCVLLTPLD